ncbi:MAG: biotin--[acetyl-CoA-carboxylase] ligase [Lachnospiraceae bacterium]|nr:biotin--[acetyl-CoA-carboxylase] ligase [Lachnospiraceae bacterium]
MTYDIDKIKRECKRLSGIHYLEEVDSTNLEAKRLAAYCTDEPILVLAEKQLNGRGRLGRSWTNSGKDAIAMSLLLRPEISPDRVSMLTIITAMAVSAGIRKATGLTTDIKWPNDLKVGGKKICGILSESVFSGKEFYSVIGIGINVSTEIFPDDISSIAASIKEFTKKEENREDIIIESIKEFFVLYDRLCLDGNLRNLTDEYNSKCISGSGINQFGELVMEDGTVRRSGEV